MLRSRDAVGQTAAFALKPSETGIKADFEDRGLGIISLNANGNPLQPTGAAQGRTCANLDPSHLFWTGADPLLNSLE